MVLHSSDLNCTSELRTPGIIVRRHERVMSGHNLLHPSTPALRVLQTCVVKAGHRCSQCDSPNPGLSWPQPSLFVTWAEHCNVLCQGKHPHLLFGSLDMVC